MKTIIIYDSIFGNTEKIAQAMARLRATEDVALCRVGDASLDQLKGIDVLIAGSPTRAFKPTPAMNAFLKEHPGEKP